LGQAYSGQAPVGGADLERVHRGWSSEQKGSLVKVIMEVERWGPYHLGWGKEHLEMMVDEVQNQ
jgi:hypothetical protein